MKTWPDAHIVHHETIPSDEAYSVPFAVEIFVFDTIEHLRQACKDPQASAHSTTYEEPDHAKVGAIIMLAEPEMHMSLVAHEVSHVALHHHGSTVGKASAKRWLADHPESIAEMIGNLTALIWYRLPHSREG